MISRNIGRNRRHAKIRASIKGTADKPRLSVFRSNKHMICQLIDDTTGRTLAAASGLDLKKSQTGTKTDRAVMVGQLLADRALEKNISQICFDRGGYKYHGRVKAVAEELRQKGLKF